MYIKAHIITTKRISKTDVLYRCSFCRACLYSAVSIYNNNVKQVYIIYV